MSAVFLTKTIIFYESTLHEWYNNMYRNMKGCFIQMSIILISCEILGTQSFFLHSNNKVSY